MANALTGISGLDAVTHGGFPRGRATLVDGGAGSGKTNLALQFLVHGVRRYGEPGIFVAFEETSVNLLANAASFGWDLPALAQDSLFFLDAQPNPDLIRSGEMDLTGLLAALGSKARAMGAKRIVFDAIDIVLVLLTDPQAMRREIYRLRDWLAEHDLTAVITGKASPGFSPGIGFDLLGFMQFMVDCSISLSHDLVEGISQRSLRVTKLRGGTFEENSAPFVISASGLEVAAALSPDHERAAVTNERVSTGVERLDTMLDGGYYRGASVLLTGSPGTAKTTLSGCFAAAACHRGEKTLFISFDSFSDELSRNLKSVGIGLSEHVASGLLRIVPAIASNNNAEIHLMKIKSLAIEHGARCIVVDPISAIAKAGNRNVAHDVAERLIGWTKEWGITSVCTSLLDHTHPLTEGSPLQVSTIADTWIHLSYVEQAGERNRALSIIKSRGTRHSNQLRELRLSNDGVTLEDVYSSEGEVLMGTLRWAKERKDRLAGELDKAQAQRRRLEIDAELVELEARSKAVLGALVAKRAEADFLAAVAASTSQELSTSQADLRAKRQADEEVPT